MQLPSAAALFEEPSPLGRLAAAFASDGHELYLVGGSVRDLYLGRVSPDLDLATDATPDETLATLKGLTRATWEQGRAFGTIGAEISGVRVEITTFRTESYRPASRHPEVAFAPDVKSDLSRRDFTINAMAVKLPEKDLVDPFGGVNDIRAGVLRTPGDPDVSFSDDPLRVLRAFRFMAQLDFAVERDTLAAIERLAGELRNISAERIRDELTKLLVADRPARALDLATKAGVIEVFLPELPALQLEQDPVHRHKDVFHHTLAVVERTSPDVVLRLAALLHDIGKPRTRKIGEQGVSFHHHEVEGAHMARLRLRALRYPNDIVDTVVEVIRLHHRFHTYKLGWSDAAVRRYVRDAGAVLGPLNGLVRADCTTRNAAKARQLAERMDELDRRIMELAAHEELERIRPDLDGVQIMAFLGVGAGPLVGRAREYLLEQRLEEGPLDEDTAYERLAEWARAEGIEPAGRKVPPKPKKKE